MLSVCTSNQILNYNRHSRFNIFNFVVEREINMGNPLDSLTGTVVLGLIITVVMVLLVNAIGA